MQRRTKWLLAGAFIGIPAAGALTLYFLAQRYAARVEPYIRDHAVAFLRDKFAAEVEIGSLRIDVPSLSPLQLYLSKGAGVIAAVNAGNITLRQNREHLLGMNSMRFEVDLGHIFEPNKGITVVYLDGVTVTIPPKGQRPKLPPSASQAPARPPADIRIGEVLVTNAKLVIVPSARNHPPLEFDLHRVRLTEAGLRAPLRYEASLRNAKPPGEITATGHFGPWNRDEAGETPLDGSYKFERADLSVFSGIGGVLHSTGEFQGKLNDITAKGEATVPDFYLKTSGNRLPLHTKFEVQVDGTNGNTILKPVYGRIGKTAFTTSGGIVKHDGDPRKTIALDVHMPAARLEDILTLAMKGAQPFMSGKMRLSSKVLLPPLSGKVIEKLRLQGDFDIQDAKFLRSQLQDRIDQMSRQAQGQPRNTEIDEVVSAMSGRFTLANELLTLRNLAFGIPGADLKLDGSYNLDTESLDFHGDLRVKARLSETQSGWKRIVLKPVDPFFAKNGAGLYTKVKITGTRAQPVFGREK